MGLLTRGLYFFLLDSCANDNIHKDFRKAIGANCIFYSAQTHELIVLVSTPSSLALGLTGE